MTETETKALATTSHNPVSATDLLASLGLQVVKQVTRTVLQQVEDVPFCVRFDSAAIESEVQTEGRGGKPKMAPARVCEVFNIATGSHQILIMNTVLEGELSKAYKDLSYVGKTFLIRSHFPADAGSATGRKRYKVYEIIEVATTGNPDKPIEGVEVVADGSDPTARNGGKPKG